MRDKVGQEHRIQRYLLRQMSAEERAEFENQYVADDELFDELVAVEDEMIGAYLRGERTEQERAQFASQFLKTPAGRQRVEFAQSWMDYVSSPPVASAGLHVTPDIEKAPAPADRPHPQGTGNPSWAFLRAGSLPMRLGIAAVWLIGVVGGSWMAITNVHLRRHLGQMRAEQQDMQREEEQLRNQLAGMTARLRQEQRVESEQQQEIAQLESASPGLPPFVLTPRLARGGNSQKPLVVEPGALWVRLQINLQYDDYSAYNVSLETPEGSQIWHRENLKRQTLHGGQPAIIVNLPANGLQSRTYVLKVTGTAENGTTSAVGDYSFHTTKR